MKEKMYVCLSAESLDLSVSRCGHMIAYSLGERRAQACCVVLLIVHFSRYTTRPVVMCIEAKLCEHIRNVVADETLSAMMWSKVVDISNDDVDKFFPETFNFHQ